MTDEEIVLRMMEGKGVFYKEDMLAALAAARADERDRCAKVCEELDASPTWAYPPDCAAAIRTLSSIA